MHPGQSGKESRQVDRGIPAQLFPVPAEPVTGIVAPLVAQHLQKRGMGIRHAGMVQGIHQVVGLVQVDLEIAHPLLEPSQHQGRPAITLLDIGNGAHLPEEGGIEGQRLRPGTDFSGGDRVTVILQRAQQHDDQIISPASVQQRKNSGIAAVGAVPVELAINLDTVVDRRQTGRRQQHVRTQFVIFKNPDLAALCLRGGDIEAQCPRVVEHGKVDHLLHQFTQGIERKRIELKRRQKLSQGRQRLIQG